jgi:hydrogenase expression/formation protein HypD
MFAAAMSAQFPSPVFGPSFPTTSNWCRVPAAPSAYALKKTFMLAEGAPENLLVLLSGRLTWPAVAMLLDSGTPGFDALIAPGHVSTVMGPEEWEFVVREHDIPAAVAGFNPDSLLAAMYSVIRQLRDGRHFLDNCYPQVVQPGGNVEARRQLDQVMEVVDANWRGIGVIPKSGYALRDAYADHDARQRFTSYADDSRKRVGEMPPGCDCAKVVLGKIYPNQCRLYGLACTPRKPIGPCMVSDEGACRIWWSSGKRENEWESDRTDGGSD